MPKLADTNALLAAAGLSAVLSLSSAQAGEWSGDAGLQWRGFFEHSPDPRQARSNLSFYVQPEFFHDWDDDRQRIVFEPFLRLDENDPERSHADVRELFWQRSFDAAELVIGLRKVFWGVTESVHLVDIVNQTDLVENLDTEDKLGQPMISLRLLRDWGTLDAFLMPWFRERTFAGLRGRPGGPLYVDESAARFESGAGERHLDAAVRWSHYFGDWDIGLAHFSGTGREPVLLAGLSTQGPVLIPFYPQIGQTSIDLQATKGGWLLKLEAFHRTGQGPAFQALAAGFEYTLAGAGGSVADLGLIAEYLRDNRRDVPTVFDKDLALGFRLAFNDAAGSELLVFAGVDLDTRARFTSVEGGRRIGQSWRINVEGRFFSNTDPAGPLWLLRDDDYLQLELLKYF